MDEPNAVSEFNENNLSSYLTLYVGPDLTTSFVQTNAVRAMAGMPVRIKLADRNLGGDPVQNVQTVLQLSTNQSFDTYADLTSVTNNLSGYQTRTNIYRFRAPRQPGIYYLNGWIDPQSNIIESVEYNNFSQIIQLEVTPFAMPWLNLLLD
jgi:hypothetical protein